jgi:predicted helicase
MLWLYDGGKRTENLTLAFRDYIDKRVGTHAEPEEIFGYIYAILHAPSYRRRYAEFLRIDFPRIPFCETKPQFDALAALGWELVQVHLLKKLPRLKLGDYHGKGNDGVEAVRYSPQEKAIHINATQHFAPVPEEVWNFHIGGYQVLDKWLKARKGRALSLDDQIHVGRVAEALAFTVTQMQKIDAAYLAAFPGRG